LLKLVFCHYCLVDFSENIWYQEEKAS
jgi:hypothetical protein